MTAVLLSLAAATALPILASGPTACWWWAAACAGDGGWGGGRPRAPPGCSAGLWPWASRLGSPPAGSATTCCALAGAAYLLWLGATSLWPRRRVRESTGDAPARPSRAGPRRGSANGVISNLCNPRVGTLFVALIPAGVAVREFSIILGARFAVETAIWLVTCSDWLTVGSAG